MIRRQHIEKDFFYAAQEMRDVLESKFENQYNSEIKWDYFSVPGHYTYLRTSPRDVFSTSLWSQFKDHMYSWCLEHLGLVPMGDPALHLMVDGCKLELHSDFHNGVWGYVFSLTNWESRRFSGGETLLLRDGVPSYKKHHVHGEVLYELIPTIFNQLLLFDDRIVHSVPTIEGSMDSHEGRVVLVGHIRATSPETHGCLPGPEVREIILKMLPQIAEQIRSYKDIQGTICYRIKVDANGSVTSSTTLTDNLISPQVGYDSDKTVTAVRDIIHKTISQLQFPKASGESSVTIPILVPIPKKLSPIKVKIPHDLHKDVIAKLTSTPLNLDVNELQGSWDKNIFIAKKPISGRIVFEPREVVATFDPPMWVPSQRQQFEADLTAGMNTMVVEATKRNYT